MRPVLIHLDDALDAQGGFAAFCATRRGMAVDARLLGPRLRLWSRGDVLDDLEGLLDAQLPHGDEPLLCHLGSGDFHHVAALLTMRAAGRTGRPLTVIHIDNHPDWVKHGDGLHCGSWAASTARAPGVDRVITIGVCSDDIRQPWRKRADLALVRDGRIVLYPYGRSGIDAPVMIAGIPCPTISALGEDGFLDRLHAAIRTEDIYLSIDKDVLDPVDAVTNWDQGRMCLSGLRRLIARLGARHRLAGADVCGDVSRPVYGGGTVDRLLKRGEAFIDQPRRIAIGTAQRTLNERANIALFGDILAAAA